LTIGLEFVFEVRVAVASALVIGESSHGVRRVVPILGGRVIGPRFNGEVIPGGADWQIVRPDGVMQLEARYTLRAGDGTLVQVTNRGLRHGPPGIIAAMLRGEAVAPEAYYCRTVAEFEAPAGPHDWLNRGIFAGAAERTPSEAIVRFHLVT
jgi:Protein of unknown function (DUF3237)